MLLTNQKTINYENLLAINKGNYSLIFASAKVLMFCVFLNEKQTLTHLT